MLEILIEDTHHRNSTVLNNKTYQLTNYQLQISIIKTKKFIDTYKARKLESRDFKTNDKYNYGISNRSPITFTRLLSIILYTDWNDLSKEFSKSFRQLHKYESITTIKRRNREYANWSKNLREAVEYYGSRGWVDDWSRQQNEYRGYENGPFYCGMSFRMVMPHFNIRLNGPTSTTKQYAVAARFSGNDGIVISLNNDGYLRSNLLSFWNCSWTSNYGAEEERIFCGGIYPIRIQGITIISNG